MNLTILWIIAAFVLGYFTRMIGEKVSRKNKSSQEYLSRKRSVTWNPSEQESCQS